LETRQIFTEQFKYTYSVDVIIFVSVIYMYILSITRTDVFNNEVTILLTIKSATYSMCETIYIDMILKDKQQLINDYGVDHFKYN
jgi:hypothetical protein